MKESVTTTLTHSCVPKTHMNTSSFLNFLLFLLMSPFPLEYIPYFIRFMSVTEALQRLQAWHSLDMNSSVKFVNFKLLQMALQAKIATDHQYQNQGKKAPPRL